MRIAIIAAVALVAGCATESERGQQRAYEIYARKAYASSQDGRADEACKTKVQFAMAGYRARTITDLEGTARANQLHASCLEYWRRTGQMP